MTLAGVLQGAIPRDELHASPADTWFLHQSKIKGIAIFPSEVIPCEHIESRTFSQQWPGFYRAVAINFEPFARQKSPDFVPEPPATYVEQEESI